MRIQKPLPLLLILTVCCSINSYAATDSLPPCIKNLATGELQSFTEYEYNGKRLFSFTTVPKNKPGKYYDSLSTIRYYDSACKLFCTWMRGGIMGSKMIPYNIKKEKIITIRVITFDTIEKKKPAIATSLPDTIAKIALLKNSQWIEENNYDSILVYRFQSLSKKPATSQIVFTAPYFDKNGKVISPKKLTRRTCWWHKVEGKFLQTQFRPGYR